ncbi:MAG: response regulator [Nitrospinota bacterium]
MSAADAGAERPAQARQPAPPQDGAGPPRGRILLVDDNPLTIRMLGEFLDRQGFHVSMFTDPLEALHADLPFRPEVVILDAMMPTLSGFEFAGMLKRALGAGIRVVMLTALGRDEDRALALAAGADDYLTKPVQPGELLQAVGRHLRAARAGRAVEELARTLAGAGAPEEKIGAVVERLRQEGFIP